MADRAEWLRMLRGNDVDSMLDFHTQATPDLGMSRVSFLIGLHKVRVSCSGLTSEERQLSREWLAKIVQLR